MHDDHRTQRVLQQIPESPILRHFQRGVDDREGPNVIGNLAAMYVRSTAEGGATVVESPLAAVESGVELRTRFSNVSC